MFFAGLNRKNRRKKKSSDTTSSSGTSRISASSMKNILDSLLQQQTRVSTAKTYFSIWRQFNKFLINLDVMPQSWEDRTSLYIAYLIDKGMQSGTVKSYVSGIKKTLLKINYNWDDKQVLLTSLTRACKLKNDMVKTRLPIYCGLLEMILYEVGRMFSKQPYLEILYKTLFALGYYGLLRVGELTHSQHMIKARDVSLGVNKDKILIVLYSSKTHSEGDRPQKVKIVANLQERSERYIHRHFCPFNLINDFIKARGTSYETYQEGFFVFKDKSPVTAEQARTVLREAIRRIGLESDLYDMHSLRIGRASDLMKYHYTIDEVKRLGRWKSNVVFKYIRY